MLPPLEDTKTTTLDTINKQSLIKTHKDWVHANFVQSQRQRRQGQHLCNNGGVDNEAWCIKTIMILLPKQIRICVCREA